VNRWREIGLPAAKSLATSDSSGKVLVYGETGKLGTKAMQSLGTAQLELFALNGPMFIKLKHPEVTVHHRSRLGPALQIPHPLKSPFASDQAAEQPLVLDYRVPHGSCRQAAA
jgi:hypothetical protein